MGELLKVENLGVAGWTAWAGETATAHDALVQLDLPPDEFHGRLLPNSRVLAMIAWTMETVKRRPRIRTFRFRH